MAEREDDDPGSEGKPMMPCSSHVPAAAQIGPPGFDYQAMAAALAQHLPQNAVPDPRAGLDTRSLGEALDAIVETVLSRKGGGFKPNTVRVTKWAFSRARQAPVVALCCAAQTQHRTALGEAQCHRGAHAYAKGKPVRLRCSPFDDDVARGPVVEIVLDASRPRRVASVRRFPHEPRPGSTLGGSASIELPLAEHLGAVRICDLGPEHVTVAWNAFAGRSLSTLAASFVARLGDGEKLGFVGLKRWREMWPRVPQPRRHHIEVSDSIHREALRCIEWAVDGSHAEEQTLRLLAVALYTPGRLDEICSLRVSDVDLRAGVLRLVDSKTGPGTVPLTTPARNLLAIQLKTLAWDATWVWPSESEGGHVRRDSVSKAWLRIRRAYADLRRTPEAAALLRWRAHDFRGALATQALEHGASVRHVQKALRHGDVRTTERYVHGHAARGARAAMELAVKPLRVRFAKIDDEDGGWS